MNKPGIEQIKRVFFKNGISLKTNVYELNIMGIRNLQPSSLKADDLICVLFKDEYLEDVLLCFPAQIDIETLFPHLEKNSWLKEGFYNQVYSLGWDGIQRSLIQSGNFFIEDESGKVIASDLVGANIISLERAELLDKKKKLNPQCQVIEKGYLELIELCQTSFLITEQNSFSYTLITSDDLK